MAKKVDVLVIQDTDEVTMFDIRHLSLVQQKKLVEWVESEVKRLSKTIELRRGIDYAYKAER